MNCSPFSIVYKYRWFGPCEFGDGKKEEITIRFDGNIQANRFDHNGKNNRSRIIGRASGNALAENVEQLYRNLNDLVHNRKTVDFMINDTEEVIIIEEPGVQLSFDANLTDGDKYCGDIIKSFLEKVELSWEEVRHK